MASPFANLENVLLYVDAHRGMSRTVVLRPSMVRPSVRSELKPSAVSEPVEFLGPPVGVVEFDELGGEYPPALPDKPVGYVNGAMDVFLARDRDGKAQSGLVKWSVMPDGSRWFPDGAENAAAGVEVIKRLHVRYMDLKKMEYDSENWMSEATRDEQQELKELEEKFCGEVDVGKYLRGLSKS